MTTIVGIKAEGKVILASDLTRTFTKPEHHGDVIFFKKSHRSGQKIHIAKNKCFAVAMTGVYDQNYVEYLTVMIANRVPIGKQLRKGYLPGIVELHHTRAAGMDLSEEQKSHLVIASRYSNRPSLFRTLPFGKTFHAEPYHACGSGQEYAIEVLAKRFSEPRKLRFGEGVDLAIEALEAAAQDVHTGGLDLVIVSPDTITPYGNNIRQAMEHAKHAELRKIKRHF